MSPTWAIVVLVIVTLVLVPSVTAKACNSTQLTENASVTAAYSSSPECAGSALDNNVNTVTAICAGACMKLLRQLLPDAPDCEFQGTNLGESMGQLVMSCDAVNSASTSSSESTGEGSNPTVVNTTDTVPICSIEDITLISDLNDEAGTNPDCLGSAGAATRAAFCAEDACVAYLTDLEYRLSNCTYGEDNMKQVITDSIAKCKDPTKWSNATTSTETEASTKIPPTTTAQTIAPSEDSQAGDTHAPAESEASVLQHTASIVPASALILVIAFALNATSFV